MLNSSNMDQLNFLSNQNEEPKEEDEQEHKEGEIELKETMNTQLTPKKENNIGVLI